MQIKCCNPYTTCTCSQWSNINNNYNENLFIYSKHGKYFLVLSFLFYLLEWFIRPDFCCWIINVKMLKLLIYIKQMHEHDLTVITHEGFNQVWRLQSGNHYSSSVGRVLTFYVEVKAWTRPRSENRWQLFFCQVLNICKLKS